MAYYYVNRNAQNNGDHEVHKGGCSWMPLEENCISLGDHSGCSTAVLAARKYYYQVNGCYHCATHCHTQ